MNLHRLLKRQIKDCFGDTDSIPEGLEKFIESVDVAYKDFDKDFDHAEHILKLSSQELYKVNNELKTINAKNETLIEQKTEKLKKIAHNLENAEKIACMGSFTYDEKNNTLELSSQMHELSGLDKTLRNIKLSDFVALFENVDTIRSSVREALVNKNRFKVENVKLKNINRIFNFEGEVLKNNEENESRVLNAVLYDVTESKLHEIELKETLQLLENYKNAIDHSAIVSGADKEGVINYVNKNFCDITGYSQDELIGKQHNILNSGFHEAAFFKDMWETIRSGKVWKGVFRNKRKDGTFYWVDSTIVPFLKNGNIFGYFSIRFDITEKIKVYEKAEDQKNFYETILNQIPVDIAVFNANHQYLFLNPIAVKNTSIRNFLIGKDDFDYCKEYNKDIKIAEQRRAVFLETKKSKKTFEFTDQSKNANGLTEYHLRRFFPIINDAGEFTYMLGYGLDITQKMEQEIKLQNSLEEKEALLGEVHHRVKNNLALVMGLIELQSTKVSDESVKAEFHTIQNRISAISMIHEKLYKSANFAKIDLKDYLQDLIKFLSTFYNKGKDITIHYNMDTIVVNTQKAIPVALIANELVTNCYKYAFTDSNTGDIFINLNKINDEIVFSISDSGIGIPEDMDIAKTNSLGFKLLTIFVKQLKGSFECKNNPGLTVNIKFKDA